MTAWWSGRATVLDFESDSANPQDARIITACVARIRPGEPTQAQTWLLKPEREIAPEAVAIHHVTTEHATQHGDDRAAAIEAVALALSCIKPDEPLIGHNVGHYDLTLLDREMRRTGVGSLGHERDMVTVRIDGRQVGAFHVIDTLVLDKWVDPYRKGKRQLPVVAEHYGVPLKGDAHTAEADAMAAGRVAWAIAKRCEEPSATLFERYRDRKKPEDLIREFYALKLMTLPELHRAQIKWAEQQATGLAEYFEQNPDRGDAASVSYHWPLEPVPVTDVVSERLNEPKPVKASVLREVARENAAMLRTATE